MKTMLAPAKTFYDLQADVLVAMNAFIRAQRKGFGLMRHPNNIERVERRLGHLWAQYVNARKICNAAFEREMERL